MIRRLSTERLQRIEKRLERLYGEKAAPLCLERLAAMVGRYGVGFYERSYYNYRDQGDIALIVYGDMVSADGEPPLRTLTRFLSRHVKGAISTVHLLPFFPYSSDDGFSVIDYREVDPELGTWKDVQALGHEFTLMFDLVLNHVSRGSRWVEDFVNGVAPASGYFLDVDTQIDLSAVVRPRSGPLVTKVTTRLGDHWLWTTFSDDQIDLNFANPDVLFEFLDILMLYLSMGARVIRLDAIAYLWKKTETSCIHLPETHEVVKLLRDFLEMVDPSVLLLTETNVPHEENISYFGDGDEAHMVYQFSLPPLLLHALVTGNSTYLTHWARALPELPPQCMFLNFTASHDGVGIRPLHGVVPPEEVDALVEHVRACGGAVSLKRNADGSESPYELNITYVDALGRPGEEEPDLKMDAFLCSQTVAMELKGMPAVYFNSLLGAGNDREGAARTGRARSINRQKWDEGGLEVLLADGTHPNGRVFKAYSARLRLRASHAAFHPDAGQCILDLGREVFGVRRMAVDGAETVVCLSNFTAGTVEVLAGDIGALDGRTVVEELISGATDYDARGPLVLAPYQTLWLRLPV